MRLLLDTHAFLWFVLNDGRLSSTALGLLRDPNNLLWLSPASYWEIAIKISTGKYSLPEPFEVFMHREIQQNNLQVLPISVTHTPVLTSLPYHHRDPFDRLLIAQAIIEQVPIVSADVQLDAYSITRLW
jgi:PIN domain nuclease of toxin-antitoxin system